MNVTIRIKQQGVSCYDQTFDIQIADENTTLNSIKEIVQSRLGKEPFNIPPTECKHFQFSLEKLKISTSKIPTFKDIPFNSQPHILNVVWKPAGNRNSSAQPPSPSLSPSPSPIQPQSPSPVQPQSPSPVQPPPSSTFNPQQEQAISEFMEITHANREKAILYLRRANFENERAINDYFVNPNLSFQPQPQDNAAPHQFPPYHQMTPAQEEAFVKQLIMKHPEYIPVLIEHVENVNKETRDTGNKPLYEPGYFKENPQEFAKLLGVNPNDLPSSTFDDAKHGKGKETLDMLHKVANILSQQRRNQ